MITKDMWEGRFADNELTAKYFEICLRTYTGVGEKHHILPKSMWPEFRSAKWNLVNLSFEDHYEAHILLARICILKADSVKMLHAWNVMSNNGGINLISASEYAELKLLRIKAISGENHPMYNKPVPAETKAKLSISAKRAMSNPSRREQVSENSKKLWQDDDTRNRITEGIKANWTNDEFAERMSEAFKVRSRKPERRELQSVLMRQLWDDDGFRKMCTDKAKMQWEDEDFRNMHIIKAKEMWQNPEMRERLENSLKSKWQDEAYKSKMSVISASRWDDPNYRKKMSDVQSKYRFEQYDLNENLIARYSGRRELEEFGYSRSSVEKVCRGEQAKYKGSLWKRFLITDLTTP